MKKTVLFLFMLFAFGMKAQEMVLLGGDVGKEIKYYIYPKTVKKSERSDYITAWYLEEYHTPQKLFNGKYYTKIKTRFLINCEYNKYGFINTIYYSKNNIVYSVEGVDEYLVKMDAVPPGSIGEDMIKSACYIYDKILD